MLKWLLALPFAAFILFNAYVYGNIITYRAVAPHQSAFMSMRMAEFRDAGKVVAAIRGDARTAAAADALIAELRGIVKPGDHVVFMSNGGFDGAPRRFLAALDEGGVVLLDPASGKVLTRLFAEGHRPGVFAFSADGKLLATGGEDATVRLFPLAR